MSPPEAGGIAAALRRLTGHTLAARLTVLLIAALAAAFALLGWAIVGHHRGHLEDSVLRSAERMSDVVERSASYSMLHNDRPALAHMIETVADEPGVVRVRVFNREGVIAYSSDRGEVGQLVDRGADACAGCHRNGDPGHELDRSHRLREYPSKGGERVLGIVNPIENRPECSDAACHAHAPSQKILGVLDTRLSLAEADADIASSTREMILLMVLAVLGVSGLCAVFIRSVVRRPVEALKDGTRRLARGDLGAQIAVPFDDELGELAASFNTMSRELKEAREESDRWARTLEERVDEKTRQLRRAYENVVQVEKMASIGKLAAVVAHEINNPLAGILTYAKLLRKWVDRRDWTDSQREDAASSLALIESESRRCGDIVRNLLMFARTSPLNPQEVPLNQVIERCVKLIRHQLDLGGIQLQLDLEPDLPEVKCDAAQVEQVILALTLNAVEAMPRGGNLRLRTRPRSEGREVRVEIEDDGVGIPPDVLPKIFEPFFTTKEGGHGTGLGLAISRGIVERHGGRIEVSSDPSRGTTFIVTLPVSGPGPAARELAADVAAA